MVATSGMSAALNARLQRNAERIRVAQNAMQMLARKNEYMQAMAQRKEEEDAARKERETERKEEREWRTADRTWVRGQKLADTARAEDDRRWNRLVQMAPFMTEEAINDVEPLGYSAPEMETLRGIQKEAARRRKLEEDYEAARTAELGRRNQPETTSPKENEDYLRALPNGRRRSPRRGKRNVARSWDG